MIGKTHYCVNENPNMTALKGCKERYDERFYSPELAPIGASEQEIQELETGLGLRIADVHREFLLWMGKDRAGIFSDEQWYLDQIVPMTKALPALLKRGGFAPPLVDYVCFYNHQGYAMAWYLLPARAEDPEIYLYVEGDDEFGSPAIWGTFSSWIEENLNTHTLDVLEQREAREEYEAARRQLPSGE